MEDHHKISKENEKKTLIVVILTVITMCAEIAYGYFTNSMALLADGYHMGTHALALGLTFTAYILAEKFASSASINTEKIGTLAGYTSSIFLGLTGIWIIAEAVLRIMQPIKIEFNEAILVAVIGLAVNSICILIMENKHHHKDYNFMAAYYHILADALTSILAIFALLIGKYLHITYFDPLVGILGGILILKWAYTLVKDTAAILISK